MNNIEFKSIGSETLYMLPENYRIKKHKHNYCIEITGQPKIGKSYYASHLDKPFFFDFYNGGLNGLKDVYSVSVCDNIIGHMESYINQLMNDEIRDKKYHTIVFDGFDVMLNKFFNEAKEMVKSNYWEDKREKEEVVANFICNYLFKWFSVLKAYKYNIVLISGQQVKYSGIDAMIKRFYNYFAFEEMYMYYSQENKIVSFDGEQYLWLE